MSVEQIAPQNAAAFAACLPGGSAARWTIIGPTGAAGRGCSFRPCALSLRFVVFIGPSVAPVSARELDKI
jgi:hypothetical protein